MSSVPPPPPRIPPPPPVAASLNAPKRSSLALMPDLEAKPQRTIPLSVTDLEVAGIRPRRRVWVTRLVVLLMFGGAGWACYHLLMTQLSTVAALNGSKANHETTRQDLYSTRNRAAAAERRAEASDTQATAARTGFEAEIARLRQALGPEFADAATLQAALRAIESVQVVSTDDPSRLTVQIPPAQLFARNDDALSDAGTTLLGRLAEIVQPANVDVWIEVEQRSRETATARSLAIALQLRNGLPADRITTVTRTTGRGNVALVLRPRR